MAEVRGTFTEYEWHDELNPSAERIAELEKAGWVFFEIAGGQVFRFYREKRKIGPKEFKA